MRVAGRANRANSSCAARNSCWDTGKHRKPLPACLRDGWYWSGDIVNRGRQQASYYVRGSAQGDDQVQGFPVAPAEVEAVCWSIPRFAIAVCVARPDPGPRIPVLSSFCAKVIHPARPSTKPYEPSSPTDSPIINSPAKSSSSTRCRARLRAKSFAGNYARFSPERSASLPIVCLLSCSPRVESHRSSAHRQSTVPCARCHE